MQLKLRSYWKFRWKEVWVKILNLLKNQIMVLVINKNTKKEEFDKFLKTRDEKSNKGFDAKMYSGVVKSFKNLDPNKIQEQLRNEW